MSDNQQSREHNTAADPLASLHRMSTTAGAASQEYVAVNLPAITAMVLGVASVLVLFVPVLMVIPVAAIVVGLVALRQVSHSNGTQTGRVFALLGILLAMGLAGFVGCQHLHARAMVNSERQAIAQTVNTLAEAIKSGRFEDTWGMFTQQFKDFKQLDEQQFVARWKLAVDPSRYGQLTLMDTNKRVELEDLGGKALFASTMLVLNFEKTLPGQLRIRFRKIDGQWYIEDLPEIFPDPAQPPPAESEMPPGM